MRSSFLAAHSISTRRMMCGHGDAEPRSPVMLRGKAITPSTQKQDPNMQIKRVGSQPSAKGPAEWFTGTVRIDPLFKANAPARVAGASVTFEPGARTVWHTHPLGQT